MRKFLAVGVVAMALAACGGNGGGGGATQGPAAGGNGKGVAPLTVNTGEAQGVGTVLVNGQGLTLYHWKGETTSSLQCTGGCLSTWIPVKRTGGSPSGGVHVTGKLTTFSRSDGAGTQVAYNGMPLYTYTGDTAPGQANGQGLQGVWFAVTPSMTASTGGASPKPSSSGYGY